RTSPPPFHERILLSNSFRCARLSPKQRCRSSIACHGKSGRPSSSGVLKNRNGWPPTVAIYNGSIIAISLKRRPGHAPLEEIRAAYLAQNGSRKGPGISLVA